MLFALLRDPIYIGICLTVVVVVVVVVIVQMAKDNFLL